MTTVAATVAPAIVPPVEIIPTLIYPAVTTAPAAATAFIVLDDPSMLEGLTALADTSLTRIMSERGEQSLLSLTASHASQELSCAAPAIKKMHKERQVNAGETIHGVDPEPMDVDDLYLRETLPRPCTSSECLEDLSLEERERRQIDTVMKDLESPSKDDSSSTDDDLNITDGDQLEFGTKDDNWTETATESSVPQISSTVEGNSLPLPVDLDSLDKKEPRVPPTEENKLIKPLIVHSEATTVTQEYSSLVQHKVKNTVGEESMENCKPNMKVIKISIKSLIEESASSSTINKPCSDDESKIKVSTPVDDDIISGVALLSQVAQTMAKADTMESSLSNNSFQHIIEKSVVENEDLFKTLSAPDASTKSMAMDSSESATVALTTASTKGKYAKAVNSADDHTSNADVVTRNVFGACQESGNLMEESSISDNIADNTVSDAQIKKGSEPLGERSTKSLEKEESAKIMLAFAQAVPMESSDQPINSQDAYLKAEAVPMESSDQPITSQDAHLKAEAVSIQSSDQPITSQDAHLKAEAVPMESSDQPITLQDAHLKAEAVPMESSDQPITSQDAHLKAQAVPMESSDQPITSQDAHLKVQAVPMGSSDQPITSQDPHLKAQAVPMESSDQPITSQEAHLKAEAVPMESSDQPITLQDTQLKARAVPMESSDQPITSQDAHLKAEASPAAVASDKHSHPHNRENNKAEDLTDKTGEVTDDLEKNIDFSDENIMSLDTRERTNEKCTESFKDDSSPIEVCEPFSTVAAPVTPNKVLESDIVTVEASGTEAAATRPEVTGDVCTTEEMSTNDCVCNMEAEEEEVELSLTTCKL